MEEKLIVDFIKIKNNLPGAKAFCYTNKVDMKNHKKNRWSTIYGERSNSWKAQITVPGTYKASVNNECVILFCDWQGFYCTLCSSDEAVSYIATTLSWND